MSLTEAELREEAISSIRQIAAMAATRMDPANPGATMLAILVTAYSYTVCEYLAEKLITLDEALKCTSGDLEVIHDALREVAAL
ncbi:MAG TPA: hypothetical protein VGF35_01170 [Steroidobacteraceae bacterium]|jgi:hypothetical protein